MCEEIDQLYECRRQINQVNVNGDGTACVCKAGFSGADCSIDLKGDEPSVTAENCFAFL